MSNLSTKSPLLVPETRDVTKRGRWVGEFVDVDEAKRQIVYSLPMMLTNVFYYCIPLVSVMFAGHLGELDLAGATLANSWATVTGFAFMTGLSGALETLCGQGFGAKTYQMLGIHLQSACIVSFFFSIIISVFWFFTEPVLTFLRQDPLISRQAALYMKYQVPGLLAYGFLQNILRFLQTQSVVMPLVVFSLIPLMIHIGIVYILVYLSALGFKGAALATSISLWISFLLLGVYVLSSAKFKDTWNGFSLGSFDHVLVNLNLSIPSAAMVCLEYWAFEILVFLAGLMPNAEITTSLVAICVNTEAIAYMFTYGLSAAASTRVANELGARNSEGAKKAMFVTIKLSVLLALGVVLALVFGHNGWAGLFSDSHTITQEFASMTPFLAVSITLDSVQGVLSGVARGCGWQHLVVLANLGTFYFIGMPVAGLLGFKMKLNAKGLWLGLICGMVCQSASLLLIALCRKWTSLEPSLPTNEATSTGSA